MFSPAAPPFTASPEGLLHRLAASLAHNVNNALTGVIGHLELALRQTLPAGAAQEHMRASLACAHRAADTVWRVVSFMARMRDPEMPGRVGLGDVAEQSAQALRDKDLPGLQVVVRGAGPVWAWADPDLLRRALDQVLLNAVEAMPDGGLLSLEVADHGARCSLAVSDTGGGIPDAVRARLFEPFVTTKASGHLGLGLALCRDLVGALGGELRVVTARGKGTTVTLLLPPAADQVRVEQSPAPHSELSKAS
jgi:signal transduction histidine kinase